MPTKVVTASVGGEKFTLFYGSDSYFSQLYLAQFELEGITFHCVKQYILHKKARFFKDFELADVFLMVDFGTVDYESLESKINTNNGDMSAWNETRVQIAEEGNRAKFNQNPHLPEALVATAGTVLVYADPNDTYWGIGMAIDDPRALDMKMWKGSNGLGKVLMTVREMLL